MATKIKISFELWDTVDQNEHIQEVHFTKDNQHFFNKHPLTETGKTYGFLKVQQVFSHSVGDKKFYKMKQIANPPTEITETLSRKEILSMIPVDESEVYSTVKGSKARAKALEASKKVEKIS